MTESSLENRLARLERANRRLWVALAAFLALPPLLAFTDEPASGPRSVDGTALRLLDPEGRVRAELGLVDGGPALTLRDDEGRERAMLGHGVDGTGLYLKDEHGHSRVGIAQFAHGGGGVALHGAEQKGAAVLYYKDGGSLTLYDAEGGAVERWPAGAAN